jgi:hypothetical protein
MELLPWKVLAREALRQSGGSLVGVNIFARAEY